MGDKTIIETNHFYNSRGYKIFYQIWKPLNVPIENMATIVHGLGEHIGRYNELAEFLAGFGFVTFGLDFYGFGRSEGKRGHVHDIYDYLKDLKILYSLEEKYLDKSIKNKLIFGHSMGGLLALAYLENYQENYNLSIISAPALKPDRRAPKFLYAIASILKTIFPSLRFSNGLKPDEITSDKMEQEHLNRDGFVYNKLSLKLFFDMMQLSKMVWKDKAKIDSTQKILFLHGGKDEIALKEDTREFYNTVSVNNKKFDILDNMKHEILTDINKSDTYDLMKNWLKSVL